MCCCELFTWHVVGFLPEGRETRAGCVWGRWLGWHQPAILQSAISLPQSIPPLLSNGSSKSVPGPRHFPSPPLLCSVTHPSPPTILHARQVLLGNWEIRQEDVNLKMISFLFFDVTESCCHRISALRPSFRSAAFLNGHV